VTSVVIPCFDEEGRIGPTLREVVSFLAGRPVAWEVIVVDDGSRDATSDVVRSEFGHEPRVRLLRFAQNHGKGWAVREGFRAAQGELVLFTDADLSTPIRHLPAFEARAAEGFDLVVASRVVEGARILSPQPVARRLAGWAFRALVRGLRLATVRDTQCGFKLMRRETIAPILEAMTTWGFAFDVELICRAEAAGLGVSEEPVEWKDAAGSKVRLWPDALWMARDLFRLRRLASAPPPELIDEPRHGPSPER
jgi:dolichyl-phosphate beta-glucosyltransferase